MNRGRRTRLQAPGEETCADAALFKPIWTRMSSGLLLVAAALLAAACSSPERLTSKATPCSTGEVKIVSSDFSRRGVTTAWCAECKGKLYLCATDAERNKVQCHPSTPDDACR